jgi:diguanylate cyclase (GGDEF)-like protein
MEAQRKKKMTVLTTTILMSHKRVSKIRRGMMDMIIDGKVWGQLFDDANAPITISEKLVISDRRKPAYVQLRKAWDTVDSIPQKLAVGWILQKTLTDPLSGLETLVAKDLSGQKPAGWVEAISDLNALKAINDTWGHAAGDNVIRELGKIVKNEIILEGGRAFRVGGDEIVHWFPDATRAKQVLESIDTKLQLHPFVLGGETRKGFSISFGIGLDAISADRELYLDKERQTGSRQHTNRGQLPESIDTKQLILIHQTN